MLTWQAQTRPNGASKDCHVAPVSCFLGWLRFVPNRTKWMIATTVDHHPLSAAHHQLEHPPGRLFWPVAALDNTLPHPSRSFSVLPPVHRHHLLATLLATCVTSSTSCHLSACLEKTHSVVLDTSNLAKNSHVTPKSRRCRFRSQSSSQLLPPPISTSQPRMDTTQLAWELLKTPHICF